ncbi:MAG: hypothetical protein L6Q33_14905 [Bacteriovoracaceae bacterium]|nr:hypothetical protein [Bacteriovoracaceae bacterium]
MVGSSVIKSLSFILLTLIVLLSSACAKKEVTVERLKVDELVKSLGPVIELKKDDPRAVPFRLEYYGAGVIADSYKQLSYRDLGFLAVEFESEEAALKEALRLKQYYHKNWLFDEVANEPSLEDLIIYKIHAINPSLAVQRTPKHIPQDPVAAPAGAAPAKGGGH